MMPLAELLQCEQARNLAELSRLADAGDEGAAVKLNEAMARCSPSVARAAAVKDAQNAAPFVRPVGQPPLEPCQALGIVIGDALGSDADPWAAVSTAVDLIAAHYRLDAEDVWPVVLDLEAECFKGNGGLEAFGLLLESPVGFAVLGLQVAFELIGDHADELPLVSLGYQ